MTKEMVNQSNKYDSIVFPQEYTTLVRTLTKTKDDFDALARCYNSFKDPESWPEGFGGALVFTGDFLAKDMEYLNIESHFIVHSPNDPKIIAGVSFVGKTWNIPNGYYVQLLGVVPAFQGKKLGKALLLHSTNYAFQQKAKLITLHTWAGNLKALPLYKRQGYKWRPNTGVYMENYIPQILNYAYFTEFFTHLERSWYEAFKPIINQEPNYEYEEQMLRYEYYFEEGSHSLKTWIDRSIGSICGFHLIYGQDNLLIRARTPNSEAYIGNEEFPVILQIENNTSRIKKVSVNINSSGKISFRENLPPFSLEILPGQSYELIVHGKFTFDTEELDLKLFPHIFSEHEITLDITVDGSSFPLKVGKVPINAVKATLVPENYSTIPNYTTTLPIVIQNAMKKKMNVRLLVEGGNFIEFPKKSFDFELSPFDTLINVPITINQSSTTITLIKLTVKSLSSEILFKQKLPIQIFNEARTVSYKMDQKLFLENKHIRIYVFEKSQPGSNEAFIIDKLRGLKVFGNANILGYPFDTEGSEFYTLPHIHEILKHENGLFLESSADSQKNLGIRLTRKIFLPNDSEEVYVSWYLENRNNTITKYLGVQSSIYWWPGELPPVNRIIPHKSGLFNLRFLAFPIDLGKDPQDLQEGWHASVYETGVIGILFDHKKIDQITIGRIYPKIDHKILEVQPDQITETSPIIYTFKSTWEEVQKTWRDLFNYSPQKKLERGIPLKSAKQLGLISPSTGETVSRGIILDSANPELSFQIKTQKDTTLKGIIDFTSLKDRLNPTMINLPEIKTNDWRLPLEIKPYHGEVISGNLYFDSLTRIYNYPLAFGFYNSSKNVKISQKDNYYKVSNGYMTFCGSEVYRGQLFSLVLKNNDENILHTGTTSFPEIKPYLWWNLFYGGIGSMLKPPSTWDEVDYNTLKWHGYEVSQGKWKGIGFESNIITYNKKIKGLQVKTEYLTLPESPFLLVSSYIMNHSSVPRECFLQVRCALKTSNSVHDYYYVKVDGQLASYHLQEHESNIWLEREPLGTWAAFRKHHSDCFIGAVLVQRQFHEALVTYAPNLKFFSFVTTIDNLEVKGNNILRFDTLYLITKDLSSIEPFTQSNLGDLLK